MLQLHTEPMKSIKRIEATLNILIKNKIFKFSFSQIHI